jgi:membrane-bound lytic murein transglycosylase D
MPKFHLVHPGDSLIAIAKRYGVTVKALVQQNRIDPKRPIFPGQKLALPKGAKLPKQAKGKETAKRSTKAGTQSKAERGTKAKTGRATRAKTAPAKKSQKASKPKPAGKRSTKASQPKSSAKREPRVHVVRKHQTLYGIARRYGVTLKALVLANGISAKRPLRVGQRLIIPEPTGKK